MKQVEYISKLSIQRTVQFAFTTVLLMMTFIMVTHASTISVAASGSEVCTLCPDGSKPKVDFTCQRERIAAPNSSYATSCRLCYCGENPNPVNPDPVVDLNLFGVGFRLRSGYEIAQLIYLGFTFFFGVIAILAVGYGIYGGVKRSQSEDPENIAAAQKIITNAVIGFVLTIVSVIAAQLVATFLGVGSINEMVDLTRVFG